MKRILPVAAIILVAYYYVAHRSETTAPQPNSSRGVPSAQTVSVTARDSLRRAYEARRSGVVVEASGVVDRVLSDDTTGSKHQRFIVRVASGQTVLIAHNIDLAARVEPLAAGDAVHFKGEYEWNDKGGVVHWTHRDPAGHHVTGWIEHAGKRVQ